MVSQGTATASLNLTDISIDLQSLLLQLPAELTTEYCGETVACLTIGYKPHTEHSYFINTDQTHDVPRITRSHISRVPRHYLSQT